MGHQNKQFSSSKGFTIVELLIVVVVIAILAAITIVAYNGIQNRAKASAAQSATSQATKKVVLWQVDNPSQSPSLSQFTDIVGAGNMKQYQYTAGTNGAFCVTATIDNVSYFASNAQSNPALGACVGHGSGGVAAITNYHPNPGAANVAPVGFGVWVGDTGNGASSGSGTPATWSNSGTSFKVTWTAVPSPGTGDVQISLATGGLQPDTKYTVAYRLKGPNRASVVTQPALYATTAGTWTNFGQSPAVNQSLTANQVVDRWVTFQATSAAYSSGLRIVQTISSKVVNDTLELSDVMIYAGDYVPSRQFLWGNSPNWVWNGVQNNSSSTGPEV